MQDNDLLLIMAAVGGVIRAAEKIDYPPQQEMVARWIILAMAILWAAVDAHSVRGFLYLLMMPIGCFKVAQVLAEPVILWWRVRHPSGSKPLR